MGQARVTASGLLNQMRRSTSFACQISNISEIRVPHLKVTEICSVFRWPLLITVSAWENGWGYVWGTCGWVLTDSLFQSKLAQYPEARKIRALWLFLHQLGAVKDPSEAALATYVKRVTKVDALQWTDGHQTEVLIETLKKWAMRYLPGQVRDMAQALSEAIKTGSVTLNEEELDGLRSTVGLAQARQTFDPMQAAWEELKTALDKREKP